MVTGEENARLDHAFDVLDAVRAVDGSLAGVTTAMSSDGLSTA
jgi:hypothetical protein